MFCSQCGKETREGSKFCDNCGALIQNGIKTETPESVEDKAAEKDVSQDDINSSQSIQSKPQSQTYIPYRAMPEKPKTEKTMVEKIIFVAKYAVPALLLIVIIFVSVNLLQGKKYIDYVKTSQNEYLAQYNEVTIGEIIDRACTKIKWTHEKKDGIHYVTFEGTDRTTADKIKLVFIVDEYDGEIIGNNSKTYVNGSRDEYYFPLGVWYGKYFDEYYYADEYGYDYNAYYDDYSYYDDYGF